MSAALIQGVVPNSQQHRQSRVTRGKTNARNKERSLELAQEIVEVPITGKIISVDVTAGDSVQEGDVICTIEAMKMENPIMAPVAGRITEIRVKVGEVVSTGNVIAIIEY
jgi:biotin carboxyl carrier protein